MGGGVIIVVTRSKVMSEQKRTDKKLSARRRPRRHSTRASVKVADRLATTGITIGGIGTIIAVTAMCLFLVAVVVPLFLPGSSHESSRIENPLPGVSPIHFNVDEYRVMGWALFPDGTVRLSRLDTGDLLEERRLFDGNRLVSWSFSIDGSDVAFGFEDGRIQIGSIGFVTDFPEPETLPESFDSLEVGGRAVHESAIIQRTPEGQLRRQRLGVRLNAPIVVDSTQSVVLLDLIVNDGNPVVTTLTSDGTLRLNTVQQFENLMTGEVVQEVRSNTLPDPFDRPGGLGAADRSEWPTHLTLLEGGSNLVLIWPDGDVVRYDIQIIESPRIAERTSLLERDSGELTEVQLLVGQATLLAGDTNGRVIATFKHKPRDAKTPDGAELVAARDFKAGNAPVTAIASSPRSRVMAVGSADGTIRVFQVTTGAKILDLAADRGEPITGLRIAPKNDGVIALTPKGLWHWDMEIGHPEATLGALFLPVWYESYEEPAHVWQSSSATDDFEPKFGLWPLVFGTLKATLYSMLFGAPIALLAAIFSSEFLVPTLRNRVKTLIEFMASLPSVVLGFLAALVFAPFVQRLVPTALLSFLTIPGTILLGSYIWQLLPQRVTLRLAQFRLLFLLALLPVGMILAALFGPVIERALFLGDMAVWLDGNRGSGFGGWLLLLLPVSALAVVIFMTRTMGPWFRDKSKQLDRSRLGLLDITRAGIGAVATLALAAFVAWLFEQTGLDPRGQGRFLDTYVQRNALVVGFVMGFAIIPIIYTIAEDALSAVPEHLRAASLGAGATQWQTAVRIVIPTAMSGLFSAMMIGLGRAVGETMIVLMAAGNTPILDINIFNGFRTLSANIAVELPEAVKDSTHYRTLFLAALILFAMTFVINTVAEIVRQRFRKRAFQL
jgi:phosphate transport system permease protein